MPTASHTPGPWKMIEVGNSIGIVPAKRPPGVSKRDIEDIAAVNLDGDQYDAHANARLIAAAPDLLAACESALKAMVEGENDLCELTSTMAMLEAAIAKARGV